MINCDLVNSLEVKHPADYDTGDKIKDGMGTMTAWLCTSKGRCRVVDNVDLCSKVMADARSTKNPIKKYTLMIMGYIVSTTYKPEEVSCNAVAGICDEN